MQLYWEAQGTAEYSQPRRKVLRERKKAEGAGHLRDGTSAQWESSCQLTKLVSDSEREHVKGIGIIRSYTVLFSPFLPYFPFFLK